MVWIIGMVDLQCIVYIFFQLTFNLTFFKLKQLWYPDIHQILWFLHQSPFYPYLDKILVHINHISRNGFPLKTVAWFYAEYISIHITYVFPLFIYMLSPEAPLSKLYDTWPKVLHQIQHWLEIQNRIWDKYKKDKIESETNTNTK